MIRAQGSLDTRRHPRLGTLERTGVCHLVRWFFLTGCPAGGLVPSTPEAGDDLACELIVWWGVHNGLAPSTVSNYLTDVNNFLAAVRPSGRRMYGGGLAPCAEKLMSILRHDPQTKLDYKPRYKLALSTDMLRAIVASPKVDGGVKAACVTAFFALLRRSEVSKCYNQGLGRAHTKLTRDDVLFVFDDDVGEERLEVKVTGKGDIYNAGKMRVVGAVEGDELDPVALVHGHFDRTHGLEREDNAAFVIETGPRAGRAVTGDDLSRACKLGAAACGANPADYASHSLRIGGASALAAAGFHDWEIAILGRWTSMTFLRYIRMGVEKLSGAAARMARTNLRALLRR